MMKLLISAAVLAFAAVSAQADTYKGRIKWIGDNGSCANGPNIGDRDNAVFHEYKNVTGERFTSLNVFWFYGGDGKRVDDDVAEGDVLVPVSSAASVGSDSFDPSSNPNATIAISIDFKTKLNGAITMTGRIQNPFGDEVLNACIVNYLFTGLKR